jgi:protein-disulfide isomerase
MAKDRDDRKQAKARLEAERAKQAKAQRQRNLLFGGVTVGIIAVIAVVVGVSIANQSSGSDAEGPAPVAATGPNGGIAVGPAGEDVPVVDIYEDFQCPACASFAAAVEPTLQELAENGEARIVYHPINLIGRQLSGQGKSSSLRSAGASACASDVDEFIPFHTVAFANQPTEGAGMSNDELIAWGEEAGITDEGFAQCVEDETYVGWAERVDAEAIDRGVVGTPTIYVDGEELTDQNRSPEGIVAAVEAAGGGAAEPDASENE